MRPVAFLFDLGSTVFPYRESEARLFLRRFFMGVRKRTWEVELEAVEDYVDLYLKLVREYGERAAVRGYKDEDLPSRLRRFFRSTGIEPEDEEIWIEEHRKAFVRSVEIPPSKIEFLKSLSEKFPLGVVTNYPDEETILTLLKMNSLEEAISAAAVSGALGYRKPHRRPFLHALWEMEVKPSREVVMVGDRWLEDVEGARATGLTGVLTVEWAEGEKQPPKDPTVPIIYRLEDALRVVRRLK
ncbi:MAG: hypothetical protein DRN35_03280 [Thermoplasmata archaeon]|nr:MAG: hypothetical protein DRN28_03760 [Thermoplasmata archaeon]RLF70965.1 MAG: hypothetical protein DRN35_03280 [Thermoplasmata archaeon]